MPTQVNSNHKMTKLSLTNYKILRILGKGSFGKVYLIQSKLTNEYYAMKQISKENMTIHRKIHLWDSTAATPHLPSFLSAK